MKITLSNKITLTDFTAIEFQKITKLLTFDNPKYLEAIKFDRSVRFIDKTLNLYEIKPPHSLVIPRGFNLNHCLFSGAEIIDQRTMHPVMIDSIIKPRPYQERVIRIALAHDNGLIVAPTGSGKTTMGIELAARLGQRCLILVKSSDLAKQWQHAIKQFTGLDAGLIGGGKWIEGNEFTVGLVQTLVKHNGSLDYGLIICDEAHNVPAQQAYDVINRQGAKYRFGLSATPQRRDNLEMLIHASLGRVIAEIKTDEVQGAVLPVTVKIIHHAFMGDAESWTDFINQLANDEDRNLLLVAAAAKSCQQVGTVVLTGTIAHAETLTSLVKACHGIDALLLHGQLPAKMRAERMARATESSLIIGTLSLLCEGIDWPHVGAIIFASPVSAAIDKETPAATRLIQSIGRARRPFKGKARAFVLDVIDQHAFGESAWYKRSQIYKRQGFEVVRQRVIK